MEVTNRYSRVLGKTPAGHIKETPRVFHVRRDAKVNMKLHCGKRADDCYHTIVLNDDVDVEDFKRVFNENSCIKELIKDGQKQFTISRKFLSDFIDKLDLKRVERPRYGPFSEYDKKIFEAIQSKIKNFCITEDFKQFYDNINKIENIMVTGSVDEVYTQVVKNEFLKKLFKFNPEVKTAADILLQWTATIVSRQFAKLHIDTNDFEITSDNNDCIVVYNDNLIVLNLIINPENITEELIRKCDENTVILSFAEIPVLLEKYHGKKIFYVSNLKELIEDKLL